MQLRRPGPSFLIYATRKTTHNSCPFLIFFVHFHTTISSFFYCRPRDYCSRSTLYYHPVLYLSMFSDKFTHLVNIINTNTESFELLPNVFFCPWFRALSPNKFKNVVNAQKVPAQFFFFGCVTALWIEKRGQLCHVFFFFHSPSSPPSSPSPSLTHPTL